MNQSEDIKDLVSALSKAQGKMKPAVFNRVNPHFRNRYADFTSCMDACRFPLAENGLSILQYCETISEKLHLVTLLAHVSGQWIKSFFPLNPLKMDSQSIGSAMTYAKRYSLSAMLGIVSDEEEDDDAETAHGRGKNDPKNTRPTQPISPKIVDVKNEESRKPSNDEAQLLIDLISDCSEEYQSTVEKFLKKQKTTIYDLPYETYKQIKIKALEERAKNIMQPQNTENLEAIG